MILILLSILSVSGIFSSSPRDAVGHRAGARLGDDRSLPLAEGHSRRSETCRTAAKTAGVLPGASSRAADRGSGSNPFWFSMAGACPSLVSGELKPDRTATDDLPL